MLPTVAVADAVANKSPEGPRNPSIASRISVHAGHRGRETRMPARSKPAVELVRVDARNPLLHLLADAVRFSTTQVGRAMVWCGQSEEEQKQIFFLYTRVWWRGD